MIDTQELPQLVRRLQRSDVTLFEFENAEVTLRLHFARHALASAPDANDADPGTTAVSGARDAPVRLKAPGMGFICTTHPLGGLQIVQQGAPIQRGQILAFLAVGEVLAPVISDRDAASVRQLVPDGALVGYGDALFELD